MPSVPEQYKFGWNLSPYEWAYSNKSCKIFIVHDIVYERLIVIIWYAIVLLLY